MPAGPGVPPSTAHRAAMSAAPSVAPSAALLAAPPVATSTPSSAVPSARQRQHHLHHGSRLQHGRRAVSCSVSGASAVGLTASGDASWDPSVGSREDGVGGVIDSCAIGHVARDITQRCPQLRRPGRLFCAASWRPAAPPVAFAAALPVWRAATVIVQLCYECAFGRLYRQPTSPLHHQLHHQLHFQPRCC